MEAYLYESELIALNALRKPATPSPSSLGTRPGPDSRNPGDEGDGRTPVAAARTTSPEALAAFLQDRESPLAPFASLILQSPYWSSIVAISSIESQYCKRTPAYAEWNCWGLMRSGGGLQRLTTPEDGISAIDAFLYRAATERGKPTLESFRGWYCYASYNPPTHVCPEWEPQVLKVREQVENL